MSDDNYADNLIDNICKMIKDSCRKDSSRPSAFKAVNTTSEQDIIAETPVVPVQYPNVIFDLYHEYDPVSSTFTPKQLGVYSVIASVGFSPLVGGEFIFTNYRVLVTIRVNGIDIVANNDFWGILPTTLQISDATSVTAILKLNAGDQVNVSATSSTNGVLFPDMIATHFEAARFSSPLICNDPPCAGISPSSNGFSKRQL